MNIKIRDALAFSTVFFVAVAACYLFGYWGAFNINVLEFISFSDLAKLALYPIVASLFFAAVGLATGEIANGDRLPVGGGRSSRFAIFVLKHWRIIFFLLLSSIFWIWLLVPSPYKLILLAFLALPFPVALGNTELAIQLLPNSRIRYQASFIFMMLPVAAFSVGQEQADRVKAGKSSLVVDVQRSQLALLSRADAPVVYMGLLGDTYVLYEPATSSIVLTKQRNDMPLILIRRN